jgi:hypothetical protein
MLRDNSVGRLELYCRTSKTIRNTSAGCSKRASSRPSFVRRHFFGSGVVGLEFLVVRYCSCKTLSFTLKRLKGIGVTIYASRVPRTPYKKNRISVRQDRASEKSDSFSTLLGLSAFRTRGGFFCCLTLFGGQRKELFALPAGANFEVRRSLVVDVCRQNQLPRVISDRAAVREFDDGQAVVKDFKGSFLPFSG